MKVRIIVSELRTSTVECEVPNDLVEKVQYVKSAGKESLSEYEKSEIDHMSIDCSAMLCHYYGLNKENSVYKEKSGIKLEL